jgi:hypothetical protein
MTAAEVLDSLLQGAGVGALLSLGWLAGSALLRAWRRSSLDRGRRSWLRELRRQSRRHRSAQAEGHQRADKTRVPDSPIC